MPQLDRSPWFAILLLSWLIFLVVIPAKVTAHFFPNSPTVKDTKTRKNLPWTWLWH